MYKKGDRVVRISGRAVIPGTKAIIAYKHPFFIYDWVVELENGGLQNWIEGMFELEEVYNSDLYKLLEEEESDET